MVTVAVLENMMIIIDVLHVEAWLGIGLEIVSIERKLLRGYEMQRYINIEGIW